MFREQTRMENRKRKRQMSSSRLAENQDEDKVWGIFLSLS